jgi:hypothetical protein
MYDPRTYSSRFWKFSDPIDGVIGSPRAVDHIISALPEIVAGHGCGKIDLVAQGVQDFLVNRASSD